MPLKGMARRGAKTKDLVKKLLPGEIAVIAHPDLDELAARSLAEIKLKAVINAFSSITGRYPHHGPLYLLNAGIPLIDQAGEEFFASVSDGMKLEINGGDIYSNGIMIGRGILLDEGIIQEKNQQAKQIYSQQLEKFIQNTIEYAGRELDIVGKDLPLPELKPVFKGKHTLIVVRGRDYREDLKAIRSYIQEMRPVLVGVDGGADALRAFGYQPDLIVGDMDSISDATLKCGAQLVVHAYADGRAPGLDRLRSLGLEAAVLPAAGTSEDVAMLIAYQMGSELIVAVGSHSNVIDFLEKGRPGMASTFLVRLKVGSILVDAKGVSKLYRQKLKFRYIAQVVGAAMIPFLIVSTVSPRAYQLLRLIFMKIRLVFHL